MLRGLPGKMPPAEKAEVGKRRVRAADAKEVGVENPAEETSRNPDLMRLEINPMVSMHRF